jgi:hypothetical protein
MGVDPPGAEERRHPRGVGDRQHVDHPRSLQAWDDVREPRESLGLRRRVEHRQRQALARERTAEGGELGTELRADVLDHAIVGRGGRAQDRDAARQQLEHADEPAVVGAEVVAPVADAVRLVDHEQARARRDGGKDPVAERRIVEPLGRDEEQVDLVPVDGLADRLPVIAVLAVDRVCAHPGSFRHLDLVAHQGEQRRHEDRGTGAVVAEQPGGDEIDSRLPPPGALHEQDPPALRDDGVDRLALSGAERRLRARDQAEELEGVRHVVTPYPGSPTGP